MSKPLTGRALIRFVLIAFVLVGCGQSKRPSVVKESSTTHALDAAIPAKVAVVASADRSASISTVPVQSSDLNGIWYGAADRTGVVIRFIGRQSRQPGSRGVASGKWVVHVPRGGISSRVEFIDNRKGDKVDLEVGLHNSDTKETFRASLGCVERGSDGLLYLSIHGTPHQSMYEPIKRIPLRFLGGHSEISRKDIDEMQTLLQRITAA